MNVNLRRIFLIAFPVVITAVTAIYHKTASWQFLVGTFAGASFVSGVLSRYAFVAHDMVMHISGQAQAQKVSALTLWGRTLKKTMLYLFLPAAIVTAIMVGIALFVTRTQH